MRSSFYKLWFNSRVNAVMSGSVYACLYAAIWPICVRVINPQLTYAHELWRPNLCQARQELPRFSATEKNKLTVDFTFPRWESDRYPPILHLDYFVVVLSYFQWAAYVPFKSFYQMPLRPRPRQGNVNTRNSYLSLRPSTLFSHWCVPTLGRRSFGRLALLSATVKTLARVWSPRPRDELRSSTSLLHLSDNRWEVWKGDRWKGVTACSLSVVSSSHRSSPVKQLNSDIQIFSKNCHSPCALEIR